MLAVVVVAFSALYYRTGRRYHVGTDDAYVNGNLVRLTPRSGTVVAINTDETQYVQRGQV